MKSCKRAEQTRKYLEGMGREATITQSKSLKTLVLGKETAV